MCGKGKTFACLECDTKFSRKDNLNSHMKKTHVSFSEKFEGTPANNPIKQEILFENVCESPTENIIKQAPTRRRHMIQTHIDGQDALTRHKDQTYVSLHDNVQEQKLFNVMEQHLNTLLNNYELSDFEYDCGRYCIDYNVLVNRLRSLVDDGYSYDHPEYQRVINFLRAEGVLA